jgi:coenzyme F420-reducing hydrogenase delta subunit
MNAQTTQSPAPWQPRIVAFFCNWCTYTAADLAGRLGLHFNNLHLLVRAFPMLLDRAEPGYRRRPRRIGAAAVGKDSER